MGWLSKVLGPRAPRVQPAHVDDESFLDEVVRAGLPVVVDVWSPGCGPCRMLEPIVMDLASEYAGRVKFAEVNAADAPETTARLGVMSTPTVVFVKAGREVERVVGFVGATYLREIIDAELLALPPA